MRTNAPAAKTAALRKPKFRTTLKRIISCKWLYLMLLPCILNFIIFHYIPMYGLQIAFKRYNIVLGAAASPWVGFKHFESFFGSYYFAEVMGNTLRISILSILIGFPAPILFALILNEVSVRSKILRKGHFGRRGKGLISVPMNVRGGKEGNRELRAANILSGTLHMPI